MSKISLLPDLAQPTGAERVPAVIGGRTFGAAIGALVQPQVDAASRYAAAAAAMARPFATFDAGIAGTAPGDAFSVVDAAGGWIDIYRHGDSPDAAHPLIQLPGRVAYAGAGGSAMIGHGGRLLPDTLERTLAWYGVDPASGADQSAQLIAAFAAAKADGVTRLTGHPLATYRLSQPLTIDGMLFDGRGCTIQREDPHNSGIRLAGAGAGLVDATLLCPGAIHGDPGSVGRGDAAIGSTLIALYMEGVTGGLVDRLVVRGGAGAGVLAFGCTGLHFGTVQVFDTEADGFHLTQGTSFVVVEHLECGNTGDDQLALIGYRNEPLVQNIWVKSALLRDGAARAVAVCGARTVKIGPAQIERSAAAGLYVASDYNALSPAQSTHGSSDVYIDRPTLIDCCQSVDSYPIVALQGYDGTDNVGGQDIGRGVDNVVIRDLLIRGAGPKAVCAIGQNAFAGRIAIDGRIYDVRGAQRPEIARLGGGDIDLRVAAERFGGDGIVWQGTETGLHRIRATRLADGCQNGPTTFNALLAWVSDATAARYDLEDVELLSGGVAGVASLGGATPRPGSLRAVHLRRDGVQVRHVDPVAEQWTYDGATFLIALSDRDEPAPFRQTVPAGQRVRLLFSPPYRLVLELIAVASTDQSRSVRLIESVSYVYDNAPAGVAGVDFVQVAPAAGAVAAQQIIRTRTGPGEGQAGDGSLIPIALGYDGTSVTLDITPPVAIDMRLALEVTRKTM